MAKHIKHVDNKRVDVHEHKDPVFASDDDEVRFDFNKFKSFFSNKKFFNNYSLLVLLLIICIFFSVFFRAYSAYLPATDDWARNSAYNSIRSNVVAQVNQQYPNLPAVNKNQLIDEQVELIFKEQGAQIEQQITATSDYFRSRLQNDDGQTYLLAIDPYQHLRRAENILKNGHVGDTLKDGKPFITKQFAPIGKTPGAEIHPYVIYFIYRVVHVFNPNISMLAAAFWAPVLISALSVIPAFFIVRRRAGLFGAFIAGLIVAIHPVFIGRTAGGFSDTDAYTVFFALLVTWLFIEGFETKNLRNKIILTAFAGFFVGVFALAWPGWWYVFDLIIGLLIIYLGYKFLKLLINKISFKKILSDKEIRGAVYVLIIFFVCSAVFVQLFSPYSITSAFSGPIVRTQLKVAAHADYWPNIQTTVAELNPVSIRGAIGQIGGKLLFFIGALGILLSLVKADELKKKDYIYLGLSFVFFIVLLSESLLRLAPITYLLLLAIPAVIGFLLLLKDDRDIDIKYAILLTLWFIGSLFASTKGTRFTLLLVPAFGIALGISLGLIHKLLTKVIHAEFKINKKIVSIAIVILLCFLLVAPMKTANGTSKNEVPSMNDAWWTSLKRINTNSSEDAIINSWWDFGHWFKYVADRAVTVDGAGQDYQLAHWMGTILISDDEEKAVNTLRMLDCGSRETYRSLLADTNDIMLSVSLTKTIIMQSEAEAKQTLEQAGISQEAIDKTIGFSFCDPPENYLITSEDMVGKAGVWGHFGSWDFDRAFIYVNSKDKKAQTAIPLLMEELELSEDEATDYYYQVQALSSEKEGNSWIAPWPNYLQGRWLGCQVINESIEETQDPDQNTSSEVHEDFLICNINKQIQSSSQGQLIIEKAIIDLDNYQNSTLIVGSYDPSTGYRTGGGTTTPTAFVLFKEEEIEKIDFDNITFPFDVLVDMVNKKVLISDPLLSESLFTKLFYLDGRYTKYFEKFSDLSTVTGQRVIVWKVKWPEFN